MVYVIIIKFLVPDSKPRGSMYKLSEASIVQVVIPKVNSSHCFVWYGASNDDGPLREVIVVP